MAKEKVLGDSIQKIVRNDIPQNAKDGKNLEQGSGTYEDGNKISD